MVSFTGHFVTSRVSTELRGRSLEEVEVFFWGRGKKTCGYMTLGIQDADLTISFKDVRHYTSPCNLDRFLKTWKAPAEKSIFPYQKFSTIEECEATTEFPPIEDFFNDLKQVIWHLHI